MRKILLIILSPFILLFSLFLVIFSVFLYCNWTIYWSPSAPQEYQRINKQLNPLITCKEMQDQELQKLCFLILEGQKPEEIDLKLFNLPWYHIEWHEYKNRDWNGSYGFYKKSGGRDFCDILTKEAYDNPDRIEEGLKKELKMRRETIENKKRPSYLFFEPSSNYPLDDVYYFRALLENPYFCDKLGFCISPSILLLDFIIDKDECYQDAASIWKDSSLCKRSRNQDFCYLCQVLRGVNREKSK